MPGNYPGTVPFGVWIAAYAAMLAGACWTDVTRGRIPNALTLAGVAMGLTLATLPSGIGLRSAALGIVAAGFPSLLLNRLGVLGGGDVKLLAAVGAFVGWRHGLVVLLLTAAAGGVFALGVAVASRRTRAVFSNLREGLFNWAGSVVLLRRAPDAAALRVSPQRVPYALAIAAGAFAELFYTGPLS